MKNHYQEILAESPHVLIGDGIVLTIAPLEGGVAFHILSGVESGYRQVQGDDRILSRCSKLDGRGGHLDILHGGFNLAMCPALLLGRWCQLNAHIRQEATHVLGDYDECIVRDEDLWLGFVGQPFFSKAANDVLCALTLHRQCVVALDDVNDT